MNKFDFSKLSQEEKPAPRQSLSSGKCEVYGCPWDATIFTAGWNCRYHHGKSGASLARITLILRTHPEDFHWYEFVLTRTPVDFLMGEVAGKAPEHLRVFDKETFWNYKARMKKHVDGLLEAKSRVQEAVS